MSAKELTVELDMLKALVQKLVEANTSLEQRCSNFVARVNSHNACYRAEISALREEVLALKAGKKFTQVAERISTTAWNTAREDLMRLNPGRTWFASADVRAHATKLAAVPAGEPTTQPAAEMPAEAEADEFSL